MTINYTIIKIFFKMVLIENKTNIKLTFEKPSINIINENKELKIISDLLTGICLEKKTTTTNNNVMNSFIFSYCSKI